MRRWGHGVIGAGGEGDLAPDLMVDPGLDLDEALQGRCALERSGHRQMAGIQADGALRGGDQAASVAGADLEGVPAQIPDAQQDMVEVVLEGQEGQDDLRRHLDVERQLEEVGLDAQGLAVALERPAHDTAGAGDGARAGIDGDRAAGARHAQRAEHAIGDHQMALGVRMHPVLGHGETGGGGPGLHLHALHQRVQVVRRDPHLRTQAQHRIRQRAQGLVVVQQPQELRSFLVDRRGGEQQHPRPGRLDRPHHHAQVGGEGGDRGAVEGGEGPVGQAIEEDHQGGPELKHVTRQAREATHHGVAIQAGIDEAEVQLRIAALEVALDIGGVQPLRSDVVAEEDHAVAMLQQHATSRSRWIPAGEC